MFVGETTLEAELFSMVDNESSLKAAYLKMHPKSEAKWDGLFGGLGEDPSTRARAFAKAINRKRGEIDLGKGDFAQLVCEAITADKAESDDTTFTTPPYLRDAIESLMRDVPVSDRRTADEIAAE